MKKFNKNILAFILIFAFIIAGYSGKLFAYLKDNALETAIDVKNGQLDSIYGFIQSVDDNLGERLSYHDQMMDMNSAKENILGNRVIFKEDSVVVKTDAGNMMGLRKKVTTEEIQSTVSVIEQLKDVAVSNGAEFLYCLAPRKELYESAPANVENHCAENYSGFVSEMDNRQIPCIGFVDSLRENGIADEDIFFSTDHHWKPLSGFIAANTILDELYRRYGFTYDKQKTDIQDYTIETYHDLFLGSYGRKAGRFFSWKGADDFDVISPGFDTHLTEEQPAKGEKRQGGFDDTVLFQDNLKKDYYHTATYATYCGGDFRLQIIKNLKNPEGKKALLVRDSFAGVVAPFLALQFSELHICDMRNFEYFVGEKINLEDYIRDTNPDYVIVLYSDVSSLEGSDGRYDFF